MATKNGCCQEKKTAKIIVNQEIAPGKISKKRNSLLSLIFSKSREVAILRFMKTKT